MLQRHARRILDDVSEAENALTGLVGVPRGTLRVSVGFTFAAGPLAPMLPEYKDDAVEVHALYPSHRSLSAKVRVFIDTLVEHLRTADTKCHGANRA